MQVDFSNRYHNKGEKGEATQKNQAVESRTKKFRNAMNNFNFSDQIENLSENFLQP